MEVPDGELRQEPLPALRAGSRTSASIAVIPSTAACSRTRVYRSLPVPEPSAQEDAVDRRRVRALIVDSLEEASSGGHTLQPEPWIIDSVRSRPPSLPSRRRLNGVVRPELAPAVVAVSPNDEPTLQLDRYVRTASLISQEILRRSSGKRHAATHNWRALVDAQLPPQTSSSQADQEAEERARTEKAAALAELYSARFSVLVGSAGTGKTTLLRVLCEIPEVNEGGILLLAPTGKLEFASR